jgi:hypothetical protein
VTVNPADIAAGVSLVGLLGLAVKGGRMAGAFERGLDATTKAMETLVHDLKEFRTETAKQFMEVAIIQERHTILLSGLEMRVQRAGW